LTLSGNSTLNITFQDCYFGQNYGDALGYTKSGTGTMNVYWNNCIARLGGQHYGFLYSSNSGATHYFNNVLFLMYGSGSGGGIISSSETVYFNNTYAPTGFGNHAGVTYYTDGTEFADIRTFTSANSVTWSKYHIVA